MLRFPYLVCVLVYLLYSFRPRDRSRWFSLFFHSFSLCSSSFALLQQVCSFMLRRACDGGCWVSGSLMLRFVLHYVWCGPSFHLLFACGIRRRCYIRSLRSTSSSLFGLFFYCRCPVGCANGLCGLYWFIWYHELRYRYIREVDLLSGLCRK